MGGVCASPVLDSVLRQEHGPGSDEATSSGNIAGEQVKWHPYVWPEQGGGGEGTF